MDQAIKPILQVKNVSKTFIVRNEKLQVADNVSFDVYPNEFLVLLGPGNCGKTVMLEMISGLESYDTGKIILDGDEITGTNKKISKVFQKLGLMPWKTVLQNVELGPKLRGVNRKERREKARYYIELVGLAGFEDYYPHQLSGGMKQRVGIARAYTADPEILIMDEPFGKLDAQTRYNMQDEIIRIWEKEKRTVIFITNNIEEAAYLSDRIILFSSRPARVKMEMPINIPRPRDPLDIEFMEIRKKISDQSDLAY